MVQVACSLPKQEETEANRNARRKRNMRTIKNAAKPLNTPESNKTKRAVASEMTEEIISPNPCISDCLKLCIGSEKKTFCHQESEHKHRKHLRLLIVCHHKSSRLLRDQQTSIYQDPVGLLDASTHLYMRFV